MTEPTNARRVPEIENNECTILLLISRVAKHHSSNVRKFQKYVYVQVCICLVFWVPMESPTLRFGIVMPIGQDKDRDACCLCADSTNNTCGIVQQLFNVVMNLHEIISVTIFLISINRISQLKVFESICKIARFID